MPGLLFSTSEMVAGETPSFFAKSFAFMENHPEKYL